MPEREAASPKSATKNPTPISSNLAEAEALLLEVRDHLGGIRKPRLSELEVAAVWHLEPANVQMNHIGRNAVVAQLLCDVSNFVFRVIALATHPQPERPHRRHLATPRERCVLGEYLLRAAKEEK
jgi:hypothetical protein